MSDTIKVRDRTTNKIREALVDAKDFERLKGYAYLTDKNSKEPFREVNIDGKRPRIALKRDVMDFALGDPRRVCYVDKSNVFDCRRSNLKTKSESTPVVKIVKTITPVVDTEAKVKAVATVKEIAKAVAGAPVFPVTIAVEPVTAPVAKIILPDNLEIKRTLLTQLGEEKLLELIPMEALLGAWAENHGYKKQA